MLRYLFLLLIFTSFVFSNSILKINNSKHIYNDFIIQYFNDSTNKLEFQDIKNQNFTKTTKNQYALGRTKGNFWLKFTIKNNSNNSNFIFSLNESFYEDVELYYEIKSVVKKHHTGLKKSIHEREVKSNVLAFDVELKQNETKTFYIKLKGEFAYFGNLKIYEKDYFIYDSYLGVNTYYILIFGALLIVFSFNSFLYIKLKEKIYLYYAGYSFFIFIYILNMSGLLAYLDLGHYLYKLQTSTAFSMAFFILFSLKFLNTKKYLKKIDFLLKFCAIWSFISAFMMLNSYTPWNQITSLSNGILVIFLVLVSIYITFKNKTKSLVYTLVVLAYVLSLLVFILMIEGAIEYNIYTRYGFFTILLFEITIFALMLSGRYNELKDQKIESQNELIKLKENTQIILEREVKKQTSELKNLVEEKGLLLKEIHHRVKNNFHTINGILYFESIKNKENTQVFKEISNRIKSMSMIHEYLYKSEDLKHIHTKEYLENIIRSAQGPTQDYTIEKNIEDILLNFDDALNLGVILNEVLTNSLKHNKLNKIKIMVDFYRKDKYIIFEVIDNGEGFNIEEIQKGLGLNIIDDFSKKLRKSKFYFKNNNGTSYYLEFQI